MRSWYSIAAAERPGTDRVARRISSSTPADGIEQDGNKRVPGHLRDDTVEGQVLEGDDLGIGGRAHLLHDTAEFVDLLGRSSLGRKVCDAALEDGPDLVHAGVVDATDTLQIEVEGVGDDLGVDGDDVDPASRT